MNIGAMPRGPTAASRRRLAVQVAGACYNSCLKSGRIFFGLMVSHGISWCLHLSNALYVIIVYVEICIHGYLYIYVYLYMDMRIYIHIYTLQMDVIFTPEVAGISMVIAPGPRWRLASAKLGNHWT